MQFEKTVQCAKTHSKKKLQLNWKYERSQKARETEFVSSRRSTFGRQWAPERAFACLWKNTAKKPLCVCERLRSISTTKFCSLSTQRSADVCFYIPNFSASTNYWAWERVWCSLPFLQIPGVFTSGFWQAGEDKKPITRIFVNFKGMLVISKIVFYFKLPFYVWSTLAFNTEVIKRKS